jgi:hypothetical protein
MSQIEDGIPQATQQDQPDSSSELPMFTMISPDGQSTSQGLIKNDSNNNNNNDRNNNKAKDKLHHDDDGNNNHSKRQLLQRYQLDNGIDHAALHHPHHLLLLQQQQQQMNPQMGHLMDGKSNLIPAPENSPSLIVLQPSAQSAGYSSFFNHYATGKQASSSSSSFFCTNTTEKCFSTGRVGVWWTHGIGLNDGGLSLYHFSLELFLDFFF